MRLKVLVSAYACEPHKGSEPGIGWNFAIHLAKFHDIWVLTRKNNRNVIEDAVHNKEIPHINFIYYDLPRWLSFWKKGHKGVRLYYYLWQLGAARYIKKVHRVQRFDLGHHVTFGKYWAPSLLAFCNIPYIWGPVGGGESTPFNFWFTMGLKGFVFETVRVITRFLGELDPLVRLTARRATLAVATTQETSCRLRRIGVKNIKTVSAIALNDRDIRLLTKLQQDRFSDFTIISIGNLLALKGFHLGIKAFFTARAEGMKYLIIGEGPERRRLQTMVKRMGLDDAIHFLGSMPREYVLESLKKAHVLMHPSLHDSGGWVSLEAMAAGLPVICLDIGGPALQVDDKTGFKIKPRSAQETIMDLSSALETLYQNPILYSSLSKQAREKIKNIHSWARKGALFNDLYHETIIQKFN